ncbi:MAG: DUF2806 domain-containing protein [Brevundimonas sp.]|nr:DUF2806 domain-containing protein [Brevundimonas sp.]
MSNDHLSNEISISGQLTETGIKAGAKSRALSSVDRLLGGLIDLANAPIENIAKRSRARGDADVELIREAGKLRLQHLHADPEVAAQIFEQHLKQVGRRHENKSAVVQAAIEDLRTQPPSDQQSSTGPEVLDDAFMNRFERYAEDATTDQLRERWGRVLASEIRTPGTFSGKVMRVVDELEPKTAALFEAACTHRIGNTLVKCLTGELPFDVVERLVTAGLLFDPGLGQVRRCVTIKDAKGQEVALFQFGISALSLPKNTEIPRAKAGDIAPIATEKSGPAIPVYVLTDAGVAISSILEHSEVDVVERLCARISEYLTLTPVQQLVAIGSNYHIARIWTDAGSKE